MTDVSTKVELDAVRWIRGKLMIIKSSLEKRIDIESKESIQQPTKYTVALSILRNEIQSLDNTISALEHEMLTPDQRKAVDEQARKAAESNGQYKECVRAMARDARGEEP